ncbi:hypothetical protein LJ655_25485 [Paraburkholderia sp. MMS20-SJTN17]|uniref:Lysine-specific metallo-endopeptidase domain-containing protein n=1 Tax=Paraburkholderia translucens TaxID=2886945 RepID=A0ABS8KL67_9BURK|nr:M35 family metallo-endopeptidase [Paraburkholderia sp. MMS20-SJTN17]MCC8405188.1 hypothetical protein [Paraburkholderia sp. MMS20-SJTN17]
MNGFSNKNSYGFKTDENEEWFEVHSGAVTNTNPGSMVYVTIDTRPICQNMTNAEFRKEVMALRDIAVKLIERRIGELNSWDANAQARTKDWFGRSDLTARDVLQTALPKLKRVIAGLQPKNIRRASPELDATLGCVPRTNAASEEIARVCAPDVATHTICVNPKFCTLPATDMFGESKLGSLIHEATHFVDTFGSLDKMYGFNSYMKIWAAANPDLAIINADSIALYVSYGEEAHRA